MFSFNFVLQKRFCFVNRGEINFLQNGKNYTGKFLRKMYFLEILTVTAGGSCF